MLIIYTLISGIQNILLFVSKIHSPRTTQSGPISPTIFCLFYSMDRKAQFTDFFFLPSHPSLVAAGSASTKHWQARLAKCSPFLFLWSPNLAIPSHQGLRHLVHNQVVWWPWVSSRHWGEMSVQNYLQNNHGVLDFHLWSKKAMGYTFPV